jgi:hypothetical protein
MEEAMNPAPAAVAIPGYLAGIWKADPAHSEIGFSVRQLILGGAEPTTAAPLPRRRRAADIRVRPRPDRRHVATIPAPGPQEETMRPRIHVNPLAVSGLDRDLPMKGENHVCPR